MSRAIDATMMAALASPGGFTPAILCMLTFKSSTQWLWSGTGTLMVGSQAFLGVGSMGSVGDITESAEVKANGTSVTLSGIDPVFLSAAVADVRVGAPAMRWLACLTPEMQIIGTPYLQFSGLIDQPKIGVRQDAVSITLPLESLMLNLQRASNRRWTAADQHLEHPDDTAFNWVEILNDIAFKWGTA